MVLQLRYLLLGAWLAPSTASTAIGKAWLVGMGGTGGRWRIIGCGLAAPVVWSGLVWSGLCFIPPRSSGRTQSSGRTRSYGRPLVTEVNVRSKYSTYGSTSGSTSGSNSTSGSTSGPNIQRQVQIFNVRFNVRFKFQPDVQRYW